MRSLIIVIIVLLAHVPYCISADSEREGGFFAEGSFLSEAFSSVSDKLDQVASGEEKIIDKDAKGIDQSVLEYDGDTLGRSRAALANDEFRRRHKREAL